MFFFKKDPEKIKQKEERKRKELELKERKKVEKLLKKEQDKEISIKAKERRSSFKSTKNLTGLYIDEINEQFKIDSDYFKVFNYSELEDYKLVIDDSSVIEGGISVGRAVVGNALLGPAGLIVGALTGSKKIKKNIEKITIKFTASGLHKGEYEIHFLSKPVKYDSFSYKMAIESANTTLEFFNEITEKSVTDVTDA